MLRVEVLWGVQCSGMGGHQGSRVANFGIGGWSYVAMALFSDVKIYPEFGVLTKVINAFALRLKEVHMGPPVQTWTKYQHDAIAPPVAPLSLNVAWRACTYNSRISLRSEDEGVTMYIVCILYMMYNCVIHDQITEAIESKNNLHNSDWTSSNSFWFKETSVSK